MPDFSLPQNQSDSQSMASRSEPASVAASADGVGSGGGLGLDENLSARQDRHEGKSRRTHFLIGLGLLLLALLLGRAAYDNWQLRSGTESLREAVADQSLRLAQVGDISAILGEDFVTPGTVLTGPDGQTYICAPQAGAVGDPGVTGGSGEAGAAGAEGSAGSAGTAGDAGLSGSQGAAGSQGATGATGVDGAVGATGPVGPPGPAGSVATIDMDDTYSQFTTAAIVTIDNAESQGPLRFDLTGPDSFIVQDSGTNFAIFDSAGDVSLVNDLYLGVDNKTETLDNVGFSLDGNDLFVAGMAGVEGTIFTDSGLTVGASTTYSDGTIATSASSPGAGDLAITAADDITLTATGNDILTIGAVNHAILGPADAPVERLSNLTSLQAADLIVGSSSPLLSGLVSDEGSLYLRDNGLSGLGELWLSDGGGIWRQLATTTGDSSTNLDEAYNNFGASAATVVVNGAEGQGDLRLNLSETEDFIIQDGGTAYATFNDSGNLTLDPSSPATDALTITQTTSGDGIDISGALNSGHLINITNPATAGGSSININDTSGNGGIQVTGGGVRVDDAGFFAEDTNVGAVAYYGRTTDNTSIGFSADFEATTLGQGLGAIVIQSEAEPLALAGSDAASRRNALFLIEAFANDTDTFNFIAFNSDVDGDGTGPDAEWRVDSSGATFADGAYSGAGADIAEYFDTRDEDLAPAELVALDPSKANMVKRAAAGDIVIGVVSTDPVVIGNNTEGLARKDQPAHRTLIGLLGQVPARVNDEGGPVAPGDYVAVSSEAGTGKKAEPGEAVVGIALTSRDQDGMISLLISPRPAGLEVVQEAKRQTALTVESNPQYKNLAVTEELLANSLVLTGQLTANDAIFAGAVTFEDHLTVAGDTAGQVVIKAGETQATVEFASDYDTPPLVQLTPREFGPRYRLRDVSTEQFAVELESPAESNLIFDWLAVGTTTQSTALPDLPAETDVDDSRHERAVEQDQTESGSPEPQPGGEDRSLLQRLRNLL